MEYFIKYPAFARESVAVKSIVANQDGTFICQIQNDLDLSKARYIAACLNACKDMDTAALESGAPGWIAEKLESGDAAFNTLVEAQKLLHAVKSDSLELQKQLVAANAENERLQKQVKALVEAITAESLAEKLTKSRIDAEYSEAETESALNELQFFGQKMYNALCEIMQNAPFNSTFDLEKIVQEGERFFVVKAPMKKIETLKDLRDVIESAHKYFDTQKVSLVDGVLHIGEYPIEPAYFVGTENGIEDTDAPPEDQENKEYEADQRWADQDTPYDPS